MSGPGLSENAQDVLSSIRRLVSREPVGETPRTGTAADTRPLLLTPAQRLDAPGGEGSPRHPAAPEEPAPYVLTQRIDTQTADVSGSGEALEWRDSDDAQTFEAETANNLTAESRAPGRLGENALVDDAALRALVAEIVREELTGEFGDRITRNVRKLVRREINRVLSGRSTD